MERIRSVSCHSSANSAYRPPSARRVFEEDVVVVEEYVQVADVSPRDFARMMHTGKPDSLALGHYVNSLELGQDWNSIKVRVSSLHHLL